MTEIIDARKALEEAAAQAPEQAQEEAPEQAPKAAPGEPPFEKKIVITLGRDGLVSVRSTGVCTVEFFGMMHEAERLTTRNVEIQEAMAMEQAVRQQQELEAVRAAIAHPAPQQPRK